MNISFTKYSVSIELKENTSNHLVIENPIILSDIITDLINQTNGMDGAISLMDNADILSIDKYVALIINPFSIDCNEKKILTKLYKEIEKNAYDFHYEKVCNITKEIIQFIDDTAEINGCVLTSDDAVDISGLFKLMGVKVNSFPDSLLEKVIDYVRVMSEICKTTVFIFCNLNLFMTIEDINYLCEFINLKKLHMINISGADYDITGQVYKLILDKDMCVIES